MAEFEDMFGIDIVPKASAKPDANYVVNTRAALKQVFSVDSGKLLLSGLQGTRRKTHIQPYDGAYGACNARFDAGKTPFGSKQINDSNVYFTPDQPSSACAPLLAGKDNRGRLGHELLFHELVHSLRHLSGQYRPGNLLGGHKLYGNDEEFIAILVSNIFISDSSNGLPKSGLRADWKAFSPLHADLSDSFEFFRSGISTYGKIKMFCDEMKDFTNKLADIKAAFNPIAAYKKDPKRAQSLSLSKESEIMDKLDEIVDVANDLPAQIRRLEHNIGNLERKLTPPAPAKP